MDAPQKPDETYEGGAYVKGNMVVDCNGKERPGWTIDPVTGAVVPPAPEPEPEPADTGKKK